MCVGELLDKNELRLKFCGNESEYFLRIYNYKTLSGDNSFSVEMLSDDFNYRAQLVDTRYRKIRNFKSIAAVFKVVDGLSSHDSSERIKMDYVKI